MIAVLKRKKKRIIETFHFGSTSIPVYSADQVKNGQLYRGFRFKRKVGSRTIQGQRTTLDELRQDARAKVLAITSGKINEQEDFKTLTGTALRHYEEIVALEKTLGGGLVSAVNNELIPARQALVLCPGISLVFAVQDYVARHAKCRPMKVKMAAARFLIAKRRGGMSERGFERLHRRLIYFTDKFGERQMAEITELNIQSFLRGYRQQVEEKTAQRRAATAARRKGKL